MLQKLKSNKNNHDTTNNAASSSHELETLNQPRNNLWRRAAFLGGNCCKCCCKSPPPPSPLPLPPLPPPPTTNKEPNRNEPPLSIVEDIPILPIPTSLRPPYETMQTSKIVNIRRQAQEKLFNELNRLVDELIKTKAMTEDQCSNLNMKLKRINQELFNNEKSLKEHNCLMRQTFEQRFNIKEEKIQIHLDENERHDIIRKTFSREEIGIRKVKKIFYYAFHKCEKCQDKTKVVRKSYVEDQAEFDNELLIFKLIAGKEMRYLVEFIGYTHTVAFNGFSFVGTILTKYYNEESLDQYLMSDKGLKATFTQLNNIVLQIAKGVKIFIIV